MQYISSVTNCSMQNDIFCSTLHLTGLVLQYLQYLSGYCQLLHNLWAGQLSRFSDWLRAGWSGYESPVGGEIFRTCPDRPWGPSSLLCNGYCVFHGVKKRPGRDADPSPPSSAMAKKEQSYTSIPRMGFTTCTEPQCLYKGALYLFTVQFFTDEF